MNFISQLIPWHRLDRVLLVALAGLMTFGLLFVYSATYNNELFATASTLRQPFVKQAIFYAAGLGIAFILCLKDYNTLGRWAYVFYWLKGLITYRDGEIAYRQSPFEREAYANDQNLDYLKTRKPYAWRHYREDDKEST